jgi:serine protease Do
VGDIILKYNGVAIERSSDLPALVADVAPGKSAPVQVWRKGAEKTFTVATFEGKAKGDEVASNDKAAAGGRLGLAVRALTAQERKENQGRAGLVVEDVSGAAARAGIQAGDLVLSFNGNAVTSVDELRQHVDKAGKRVALLIQRDGQQLFVPLDLG